jgi:hypothetical protein
MSFFNIDPFAFFTVTSEPAPVEEQDFPVEFEASGSGVNAYCVVDA